ncbi:uncharacterized protein LOC142827203 isoform X4 [Pelodiscus sinensis]|uniref:uncharacterized protein LOC142827203 isoform X4 n=1 Tax=Pelodiscus sinensis TaxID=13735 RepID=UPI003F6D06D3
MKFNGIQNNIGKAEYIIPWRGPHPTPRLPHSSCCIALKNDRKKKVKTPIIVWPDVAPEKEQEGQSQLIVLEEEMGTMTLSLKLVQGSQVIS